MFPRIRSFFGALTERGRFERDMSEEMRFHMEAYEADLLRSGVPAAEARRRSRAEFGSKEDAVEECRRSRGLRWPDELARNVRYAVRVLRRSPIYTATAIATLALCIGANTAIFSVVDAVMFRPLPYAEPDRLAEVVVHVRAGSAEGVTESGDGFAWEALQRARHFELSASGASFTGVSVAVAGKPLYVQQQRVTAGYFRVLGAPLSLGREFTRDEDRAGGARTVILSDGIWTRLFAQDRGVIGKQILVHGEPHTVVGILPAAFWPTGPTDIWTPLRPSTSGEGAGQNYSLIARLRPGATWAQARGEAEVLGRPAIEGRNWPRGSARMDLMPLQQSRASGLRTRLYVLWGAVGMVLLIGCVNIAGLLLARSSVRAREIGTRVALGGGRAAVIRQVLTESAVLALGGGIAGVGLGYIGIRLLSLTAERFGIWQQLQLDGRVLGVTLLTALFTSIVFGLAPALYAARVDIRSALAEGGSRSVGGAKSHWARRALVVAEVALGVVLLVGAGLLLRTLAYLQDLDPGFDSSNVLTATVALQDARYPTTERVNWFFERSLEKIRRTPGVESAAAGLHVPYQRWLNDGVQVLDGPGAKSEGGMTTVNYVTPYYFETLRIPLLSGRYLDTRDRANSAPVAVVNQAFARKFLKEQEPIGSHVGPGPAREIVGVVGNVQQNLGFSGYGPLDEAPALYIPVLQIPDELMRMAHVWFSPSFIVRGAGTRRGLIAGIQRAAGDTDPLLPFAGFQKLEDIRDRSLGSQRLHASLLSVMAGIALLLAAVGISGLIASSVAERTRELGIRMALGATLGQVMTNAAAPGVLLAAAGVAVGSILAMGSVGVLQSSLYGVTPADPATFVVAGGGLLIVALLASFVPALRLVRLDPARTLREE